MINNQKLSNIADIITGFSEDKDAQTENSFLYQYIQPNNLSESGKLKDTITILKKDQISADQLVQNGDVLVKRLNPNVSVIALANEPTIISTNLYAIRVKRNDVLPEYLASLFEQPSFLSQIEHISGTATVIKAISAKKLANVMIPLIPIHKQKALGMLWTLNKKRKQLLLDYISESDKLFSCLTETIISDDEEDK